MSYTIITDPKKIDHKVWSDFVHMHPNGNIFQTPEFFDIYAAVPNHSPFVICCINSHQILGLLCGVIINEFNGLLKKLTARAIIQGGPITLENNTEVTQLLITASNKVIKKKALYTQIRNLYDTSSQKSTFEKCGFIFEEHLNILVDLTKSEADLWQDVHSKRRNEIRRAIKEEFTFKCVDTEEELFKSYKILKEVYKYAKLPLPNLKLFQSALRYSTDKEGLRIFAAIANNEIIGVMLALCYKKTIYDWYAGSYRVFYNKYPNDLIPWKVFKWGKTNGYEIFDFGGAGKPNISYGVRDYKKKFGGQFVNYGRYELIHKKCIFQIAKIGFKIWQRLKK